MDRKPQQTGTIKKKQMEILYSEISRFETVRIKSSKFWRKLEI